MSVDFGTVNISNNNFLNSPISISLPDNVKINEIDKNEIVFIFSNLEKGFGTTIGNAYRRTLLSSVGGFAITGIKVAGVRHEFDCIPGVVEDMISIILNLKQLKVRRKQGQIEESERILVNIENMTSVSVGDCLKKSNIFEPVNPNFIVFNIDPSVSLNFEIIIEKGIGFRVGEAQKNLPEGEGFVAIDSIFAPVKNVRFNLEEESLFENLNLFVVTDGTITPKQAMEEASKVLVASFSLLLNTCAIDQSNKNDKESIFTVNESVFDMHKLLMTPICNSSVNLSVRACNCLKSANISTLGDLVSRSEEELMELKNFGKKSLKELKALIENNNLTFGMDLSDFKIYKNK